MANTFMNDIVVLRDIPTGNNDFIELRLHKDICGLEAEWLALEKECASSIYQNYHWVKTTFDTIEQGNETCIVTGRNKNGLQFILPMVMEKCGSFNIVRWAGGSHANLCSGIFTLGFLKLADRKLIESVVKTLAKQFGGITVAKLNNQRHDLDGTPNPFLKLPVQKSVHHLYELDISSGLNAVLELGNAKRKRRQFRRQVRVAEENGGYELFIPRTPEEIEQAIDCFLKNKAIRFKEIGVHDVFANDETVAFMKALALQPERDGIKPFHIFELKIGGITRAMYGCGLYGDYCHCCVNAVTYDDLAYISPGEMILHLMIEHLHANGFKKLDLGVGDERYKVSWCRTANELFDSIIPLSGSAVPVVWMMKLQLNIKRKIRGNNTAWLMIKNVRKRLASLKG